MDALGGEPLGQVEVALGGKRAVTDTTGRFEIAGLDTGDYDLSATTVGYRLEKRTLHLDAEDVQQLEIALTPSTIQRRDSAEVRAQVFDTGTEASPTALTLAANDLKNLGSVLTDDPLRAVQGLPGVSSNDDFEARFEVRGADFSHVGIYLDGILLHTPLHTIQNQDAGGSASAINGDMISELNLFEGAFPSRFPDRTAAVLDVASREGSRTGPSFRASIGMSYSGIVVEGPLGKAKKGSWIASYRKSYLQYLASRLGINGSLVFGLEDGQARASYDLTPHNNVAVSVLESYTSLDRSSDPTVVGINALFKGAFHFTFTNASWRYTPNAKLLVTARGAWMREKHDDFNNASQRLDSGHYGEWVGGSDLKYQWTDHSAFAAGISTRETRDTGYLSSFNQLAPNAPPLALERHDGKLNRAGGFAEQAWTAWRGRLHMNAGGRWDHQTYSGATVWSPQSAMTLNATNKTFLQVSWGQYSQFPEVGAMFSNLGSRYLLPARSTHLVVALEQALGSHTRLRVESYQRNDRDLLAQPNADARIVNAKIVSPLVFPPYLNSARSLSRGVEFFLERRSANRIGGWVSYAFGKTRATDGVLGVAYPSDWDQRHSFNGFATLRLRPTVNLSLKSVIASGFPIPGFFRQSGSTYLLTNVRNQLRLPAYERTDFRVNKTWTKVHWKTTLFGEVVNITNRGNKTFDSFDGFNAQTGVARVTLDKMFPILPAVGLVFER